METALNNKSQLAHCPDETSSDASKWNYDRIHDKMHFHLQNYLKVLDDSIQPDESLVLTTQIATPHYKYGEQILAFNGDDSTLTIQELLDKMGIDTSKEIKTNDGSVIDINEYAALCPIFEIYLTNSQNDRKYDLNGTTTISLTCEIAKEQNQEDLIVLYIEADSNKVNFMALQDFNPGTGEITIELSKLGVIGVLSKE